MREWASSFGWLDYSERDRKRAFEVLNLFRERDTRDELGIGSVRDAYSDLLFPGTSTVHTRARYVFFISWIYMNIEKRKTPSAQISAAVRRGEVGVMEALRKGGHVDGLIGLQAGAALKRWPSSIYWESLEAWGLRLREGGRDAYHRSLDEFYKKQEAEERYRHDHDGEESYLPHHWCPGLPEAPEAFPNDVSFQLSASEAHFLRDRIMERHPRSLLAWILAEGKTFPEREFPWELLPQLRIPARLSEILLHARNFSESIHGIVLLYNYLLAGKAPGTEARADYARRIDEWAAMMDQRRDVLATWDRAAFWQHARSGTTRIPAPTQAFVEAALNLALDSSVRSRLTAHSAARKLVTDREARLKRGQARLNNPKALQRWGGESGTRRLAFRWPQAQRIVFDVLNTLDEERRNA